MIRIVARLKLKEELNKVSPTFEPMKLFSSSLKRSNRFSKADCSASCASCGIERTNKSNIYIDLAKPKSGAPGLFILTGCRISENKRLWNCPPFGFPGNCLIMSVSSLPN